MGFEIVYNVQDEKASNSLMSTRLPSAVSFNDAIIFASEFAPMIQALITGAITRIGVAFTVDLPAGLRSAPLAGSDVEEGGRFQFNTAGGNITSVRVPTLDESKVTAGSSEIDVLDSAVATFVTVFEDGMDLSGVGGSGVISPSDSRDEDITALKWAREAFQRSRRG